MKRAGRLQLEGVHKHFELPDGRMEAVAPLSLTIEAGQFVALVGPSGCGKSTLLRMVAGLEATSGGHILLDGRPVTGPGPERVMLFQSPALYPWLTTLGNVTFVLTKRIADRAAREALARRYLREVGLAAFEAAYPTQLSGGMQQRVALARALAFGPEVLLMDEPFGALDAQTRSLMQELLLRVWQENRATVLFVTHDVDEAIFLADRVLVMSARPGRIIDDLPVPLPRPRSLDVQMEADFLALKRRVLTWIRREIGLQEVLWL